MPDFQCFGGGGGIRTPGTLPFNSFQDCRHRPLGHTSNISFSTFPFGGGRYFVSGE